MQITQNAYGVERIETFVGKSRSDIFDAMDARAEQLGERVVKRAAIGRNSPCHCGSDRKFKKCCMPLARVANRS